MPKSTAYAIVVATVLIFVVIGLPIYNEFESLSKGLEIWESATALLLEAIISLVLGTMLVALTQPIVEDMKSLIGLLASDRKL